MSASRLVSRQEAGDNCNLKLDFQRSVPPRGGIHDATVLEGAIRSQVNKGPGDDLQGRTELV